VGCLNEEPSALAPTDRLAAALSGPAQEAARLMAGGDYAAALPVALDAVRQGEALFRPGPALQMFPLYLLVGQANLGLRWEWPRDFGSKGPGGPR
jgi:hypothetical protein